MLRAAVLLCLALTVAGAAHAQSPTYTLKPGDMIGITIWKEADMARNVRVLPDGTISYPLAGHLMAAGKTPLEVEQDLARNLSRYFKDAPVTVSVVETAGSQIFVIGQVKNPGAYPLGRPMDVMQALSLAGGLGKFADEGNILILRRDEKGTQKALPFSYKQVKSGRDLASNRLLRSGDVVVVRESGMF